MKLVNLINNNVRIFSDDEVIERPAAESTTKVDVSKWSTGEYLVVDGVKIPLVAKRDYDPQIPSPRPNVRYIVDTRTAKQFAGRRGDLLVPEDLVIDQESGKIKGCRKLSVVKPKACFELAY